VAFGYLKMNRFRRARSHSLPAQGCSTDIPVRRPTEINPFPAHDKGDKKKLPSFLRKQESLDEPPLQDSGSNGRNDVKIPLSSLQKISVRIGVKQQG